MKLYERHLLYTDVAENSVVEILRVNYGGGPHYCGIEEHNSSIPSVINMLKKPHHEQGNKYKQP